MVDEYSLATKCYISCEVVTNAPYWMERLRDDRLALPVVLVLRFSYLLSSCVLWFLHVYFWRQVGRSRDSREFGSYFVCKLTCNEMILFHFHYLLLFLRSIRLFCYLDQNRDVNIK